MRWFNARLAKRVIVLTRTRTPVSVKGRDVWWEDEIKRVETGTLIVLLRKWMQKMYLFIQHTSRIYQQT